MLQTPKGKPAVCLMSLKQESSFFKEKIYLSYAYEYTVAVFRPEAVTRRGHGRAVSALNLWAISPAPGELLFSILLCQASIIICGWMAVYYCTTKYPKVWWLRTFHKSTTEALLCEEVLLPAEWGWTTQGLFLAHILISAEVTGPESLKMFSVEPLSAG